MGEDETRGGAPSLDQVATLLRWMLAGLVIAYGPFSIVIGRFSLVPIGAACFAWSAFIGWSESERGATHQWWCAAGLASAAAAAASLGDQGVAYVVGFVAAAVALVITFAWALATTAQSHRLKVAARWRLLAWASLPAAATTAAATALVLAVGEIRPEHGSGLSLTIGRVEMTLPMWAWPVAVIGVAPMAVVVLGGVVACANTYQEVTRAPVEPLASAQPIDD